jgi:hypothetical protein
MEDPTVKFVLLIPLKYNDGRAVPSGILRRMRNEIYALFGGLTQAGTVRGAYRMRDGTKKEDESLEIWIGIRETEIPDLKDLVARFGAELGQESMYLERTGGTIDFIPPIHEGESP